MKEQKTYSQQFKNDAVAYRKEHEDLSLKECASKLGISSTSLNTWLKAADSNGSVNMRGSGNYSNDEQKEIARLRRELKDTKDALDILKKAISILGK